MDVVVTLEISGQYVVRFVDCAKLDPQSGWVLGNEIGRSNSIGVPVQQVVATKRVPDLSSRAYREDK